MSRSLTFRKIRSQNRRRGHFLIRSHIRSLRYRYFLGGTNLHHLVPSLLVAF